MNDADTEVVTVDFASEKEPTHILDKVATSPPKTLWFHVHDGKTIFSRWLAINRARRGVRYRHTPFNIDRVVSDLSEMAASDGVVAYDNGNASAYLQYARVTNGNVEFLKVKDVPRLKANRYFIWHG